MKKLLFAAIIAAPGVTLAQFDVETGYDAPESTFEGNPYPIIVQPGIPVPRGSGPWGTGYSIITETRERPDVLRRFLGESGASRQQTIQKVVPNDALGNPINPLPFD